MGSGEKFEVMNPIFILPYWRNRRLLNHCVYLNKVNWNLNVDIGQCSKIVLKHYSELDNFKAKLNVRIIIRHLLSFCFY